MTAHAHDTIAPATSPGLRGGRMPGASGCPSGTSTGSCCAASTTAPRSTCSPPRCGSSRTGCPRSRRGGAAPGTPPPGGSGPGPGWCWLTRDGMTATGLGFPATRPALGRLAHLRAILAARLWMAANPAWAAGPGLVAFRAAAARRPARGRPAGAHPGRGDPLALHRRQPVRGAGVGDRGRADPQAARRGPPGSWPGCCPRCGTRR